MAQFPEEIVHGDGVTLVPERWTPAQVAFAVTDRPGGDPLGHLDLERRDGGDSARLHCWLDETEEGLAAAALVAVGDWAFAHDAHRIEVLVDVTNAHGQRVAMAAGYVREGLRRGMPTPDGGIRDLVPFGRLPGDPRGPVARVLPDLPGGALTDGVVTLRPLTSADTADTYRLRTTPDVVDTWLPPVAPTAEEVRMRCAVSEAGWLAGSAADLIVRDAATDAYAGEITVDYQAPPLRQAMLGYGIVPAHRGKGFAGRAVVLVTRWAFEHTGIERLVASTLVGNVASQRVLERAGFEREGLRRGLLPAADGTRRDNIEFAVLRTDHSPHSPR